MAHRRTLNGKTEIAVNGQLIQRGLTARAITAREAARRTGTTFNIIHRATRENSFSADLPIRHLIDLADLLGVQLRDLLDEPAGGSLPPDNLRPVEPEPDRVPAPPTEGGGEADAQRLARFLLLNPAGCEPAFISHAWAWPIDRLLAARRRLNHQLVSIGMTVANANDRFYVTVAPGGPGRPTADNEAGAILALATAERPMTITAARLLRNALDDTWPNQIRTGDAPHAAYLVNIGLIGPNPAGDYQPTPALLDAFPE